MNGQAVVGQECPQCGRPHTDSRWRRFERPGQCRVCGWEVCATVTLGCGTRIRVVEQPAVVVTGPLGTVPAGVVIGAWRCPPTDGSTAWVAVRGQDGTVRRYLQRQLRVAR